MLAAHLLNENATVGLKSLASRLFGVPDYSLTIKNWDEPPNYIDMLYYQGEDAFYTVKAEEILKSQLIEHPHLARLFAWQVMPTSELASRMEERGIPIDIPRLKQRKIQNDQKQSETIKKLDSYLTKEQSLNWNSSQQVSKLLFTPEGIGLTPLEMNQSGPSVRENVLKQLVEEHPIPKLLLEYRKINKNKTTFFDPWTKWAENDGRIHSHYKLANTVTGRASSSDPNIHQVPRDPFLRSVFGINQKDRFGRVEWYLVEADLSQIELRLAAWFFDETVMIREFNEGQDPHTNTAMQVSGLPREEITKEIRKKAKAVNFGFVYGMGWKNFIKYAFEKFNIIVTPEEAKAFRLNFFKHWPGLTLGHEQAQRIAHKYHEIQSPNGRTRHLPYINSQDRSVRAEAERQSINAPIQGFASDLCFQAAIELEGLTGGKNKIPDLSRAFIVGQIHDALLFIIHRSVLSSVLPLIKESMEYPSLLDTFKIKPAVDLEVEIKVGTHWADPDQIKWDGKTESVSKLMETIDTLKEQEMVEDGGRRTIDIPEGGDDTPPWYLPEGWHPLRISKMTLKESPNSKWDYIEVEFDTLIDGIRKCLRDRLSLSPKAIWSLRKVLAALNQPSKGGLQLDLDQLVGMWCMGLAVDRIYQGKVGTDITDYGKIDKPPDEDLIAQLNAIRTQEEGPPADEEEDEDLPAEQGELPW